MGYDTSSMTTTKFNLLALAAFLVSTAAGPAAVVFQDTFGSSSLNGPSVPSASATSYDIASSKDSTGCSIAANALTLVLPATTAGFVEAQALFAPTPVALGTVGDYLELTASFTVSANVISGASGASSFLCYGLYNSSGTPPLTGLANSGLSVTAGSPNSTGGAQGWTGYVSRVGPATVNSTLVTRPAQSGVDTSSQNQDLIGNNWGSGAYDTPAGATLGTLASSTSLTDGGQYTLTFRITLTAVSTCQIESKIYNGVGTGGSIVFSQTASASGANFLTSQFDGLALGFRFSGTSAASALEVNSIVITSSTPVGPGNEVAGLYYQQPPTAAVAGAAIAPAITVVATNSAGAPVTNVNVTLSLQSGTGPVNGTLIKLTDASGSATFEDVSLTSAGSKQLRAASGSATADSVFFTITNAPAAQLVFTTQPSNAGVSNLIAPPVVVQLRDAYGTNVASNATISLTLSSGTGILSGTTSLPTDATGKSAFTNLSINLAGVKQLTAAKTGLPNVASSSFSITQPSVPAFPGAEGAGKYVTGGRGTLAVPTTVFEVTNLLDSNTPGTLRYACSQSAPYRTIVFRVSGTIHLTSRLNIPGNTTVAGQTAPGDGICLADYETAISGGNVIIRHLRFRLGDKNQLILDPSVTDPDCWPIWPPFTATCKPYADNSGNSDSVTSTDKNNLIIDHCSVSWSTDEALSLKNCANTTIQWTIISEPLDYSYHHEGVEANYQEHGYGGIYGATNTSLHHNLYAHCKSRTPRFNDTNATTLAIRVDMRNNVIYNWRINTAYGGAGGEFNIVSNYYKAGPDTTTDRRIVGTETTARYYLKGNKMVGHDGENGALSRQVTSNNWFGASSGSSSEATLGMSAPTLANIALTTEHTADATYAIVLAQSGATMPKRDSIDARIVNEIKTKTGTIIDVQGGYAHGTPYSISSNAWPVLVSTPAPTDTDHDGMPDYWEAAVGLNPNLASDRSQINTVTGYTRLEEYLNWLADAHALCDRNGTVDVSLRAATGGATNLTYSVTSGGNGTVTLLGDGYTARFTAAANTNGVAGFTFTATDPVTAASFGPVNYGILITTTNAPVVNTPPVLAAVTNRTMIAGTVINFTCSVTDTDTPPQSFTFTLPNPPAGATLGPTSGVFNWRPAIAQSDTTNLLSLIATDNGVPPLAATQQFTVTVSRPVQPLLQQPASGSGGFEFQVGGEVGPDYILQASTNLTDWSPLLLTNPPALPFGWTDVEAPGFERRFYRVLLGP
jgi:hypothetical protein